MTSALTIAARRLGALALLATLLAGCGDSGSGPDPDPDDDPIGGGPGGPAALSILAQGRVTDRYTSELWIQNGFAYTGSWGLRGGQRGNVLNVWDAQRSNSFSLIRSINIAPDTVTTLGDVQVSDDGKLLVVATEPFGSLRVFGLDDPGNPRLLSSYTSPGIRSGVHTAEVARVNGKLYAFLSIDPGLSRLVVVDLSTPEAPVEVFSRAMGVPFIHDVFVRDGILFTALWNGGLTMWDIGGGGKGGSVTSPVQLGNVVTAGGQVHNVWWYHASDGSKRYAFVGQETPTAGGVGVSSAGDIHVVDMSNMSSPKEVAFFNVPGAGTHNFSMDEARGILFAAYYNGGVRALDVRGDLGTCTTAQKSSDGRCDLGLMGREIGNWLVDADPFVWGVQYVKESNALYASDMLAGLYRLDLEGLTK
jgi:hypothetical protein